MRRPLFAVMPMLVLTALWAAYAQSPEELRELRQQAIRALRDKKLDEAIELYKKITAGEPSDVAAHYNLACAHSLKGEKKAAIDALKAAVDAGYSDFAHMEKDSDLDNIRDEPGYKSLLTRRDEMLTRGAKKRMEQLKQRFGSEYIYEIDKEHRIIYALCMPRAVYEKIKKRVNEHADALWNTLFTNKPTYYLTILIPSPEDSLKMSPRSGLVGFYSHRKKELVSSLIGLSLRHEFTHALHSGDCDHITQAPRIWVDEGLATLFENSQCKDGEIKPRPNFRLGTVRKILGTDDYVPWERLFRYSQRQFEGRKGYIHYAEARYILYYFWHKGKLKEWYDTYYANFDKDNTGKFALEKVFGKPLAEVEAGFKKWIPKAPEPAGPRPKKGGPVFKAMVQECAAGIQVMLVGPGSEVEKAGIKPCDIILEFAGRKYTNVARFLRAVSRQKAGKSIKVKILRGSRKLNLEVKLEPRR